jgi:hypothetical protein
MRRILLGLTLLLPGCANNMFGSPFVGFGGFIADTHSINRNPNQPKGDSTNMQRVQGTEASTAPLLPEPGNVWPGPPPPEPTLEDIEKMQNTEMPNLPAPELAPMPYPGSSTPPGSVTPTQPPQAPPTSQRQPRPGTIPGTIQQPPATIGTVQTRNGQAVISSGSNGIQTFTLPDGTTGRAVPNANGTVTLISPDGSVQSVPAPR